METGQSTGIIEEGLAETSLEMESQIYREVAQEGNNVTKRASELMNLVGYEAAGKGEEDADAEGEKNGVSEAEGERKKKDEEGNKTKEGTSAEVGQKRERDRGEGATDAGVAVEQVEAEEGGGKQAKKLKTDEDKETH